MGSADGSTSNNFSGVTKRTNMLLRPQAIIEALDLLTTSYLPTAAYGHFGRTDQDFPWERLNRIEELRQASGL
jgi:S-adenosylmethionine synthetase